MGTGGGVGVGVAGGWGEMGVWVEGAPSAPIPDAEKHEPGEHRYSLHGPGQLGSTATTGRDKESLPPHPQRHKKNIRASRAAQRPRC